MADAVNFFKQYEAAIYFVLGLGGIIFGWRFWEAWQLVRASVFGLEREGAQKLLNRNALILFILLIMGIFNYSLVTFVAPLLPVEQLEIPLVSDVIDGSLPSGALEVTPTGDLALDITATPLPTVVVNADACISESVNIISPESGEAISGEVEVLGTANIENFGFYKLEIARAEAELWLTIVAGRDPLLEGALLEIWDTSQFQPGEYVLQLIVVNNNGEEAPPCRIPIRIGAPVE